MKFLHAANVFKVSHSTSVAECFTTCTKRTIQEVSHIHTKVLKLQSMYRKSVVKKEMKHKGRQVEVHDTCIVAAAFSKAAQAINGWFDHSFTLLGAFLIKT